jgi:hypothetical protein
VIADPPSLDGTVQVIFIVPPVPVPLTPVGAEGTPAGVTDAEEVEAEAELPAVFVAVEVNV